MHQVHEQYKFPELRAHTRRVLIVERDAESASALLETLAREGFAVTTLIRIEDARTVIDRDLPHLVMLDWDLPESITTSLVRHMASNEPAARPRVMALSLHSGEQQIVSGFELGVDDYVVKPFSLPEVAARVKAILRTTKPATEGRDLLEFHRLQMDVSKSLVTIENQVVPLRPMQFRLLEFLVRHPERVFSRAHLLDQVWGGNHSADPRAVDINVQRIRRALAPRGCNGYLQTVRGVGYRMSAGPQPSTPPGR
jgi:two-component system phosphate regulon response regulator PhoB